VLGERRLDQLGAQDVAAMIAELHPEGLKPSCIGKIVHAIAMVLDHARVQPNPARDTRPSLRSRARSRRS
jgi:hypothetical protein